MICVSQYELSIITNIIQKRASDCDVLAFGSRFKWTPKDYSDLDLAFVSKNGERLGLKRMGILSEAFMESDLPYRVDIVDYFALSPEFKGVVDGGHEVIFRGEQEGQGIKYKETIFGLIPSHWELSSISDYADVVTDYVANGSFAALKEKVQYLNNPDYAVLIRLTDFNNDFSGNFVYINEDAYHFLKKSKLIGGEIIISNVGANVGTVFRCPVLPYKMSLAPNAIMVNFKGDNNFYYYWLKSAAGQFMLKSIVSGSAQPKFNKTDFRKIVIPAPPIEEQKKIADILSALDAKIAVNKDINQHLEQMVQAIYKSWFIDFEPFKDNEFIDSELGEIPMGWNVISLNDIVMLTGGYSYKSKELLPSKTAMATIKNFNRKGGFKTDGFKEIVVTGKSKPAQYVEPFDILVAHTDVTQNADIIGNAEMLMTMGIYEKIIISLDIVKVKSCLPELSNFVLAAILRSPQFKSHALGYVNGTTVLHLSKRAIPEYKIAFPRNTSILTKLNSIIEPMYRMMASNIAQNIHLASARDVLLPRLTSGHLSVDTTTNNP